jgi:hypothetical protein
MRKRPRRLELVLTLVLVLTIGVCSGAYFYHVRLNRELRRAAAGGDTKSVVRCLKQGAAINTETKYKETPLLLAARRGSMPTVRLLLERGAKVDARDSAGETALWWVAARDGDMPGRAKLAELLLSFGADPNVQGRGNGGLSALGWAAAKGDGSMVEALLRHGANPNVKLRRYEPYVIIARRAAYTRAATVSRFHSMAQASAVPQGRSGWNGVAERERVKQREAEKAVRLLEQASRAKARKGVIQESARRPSPEAL